MARRAAKSLPEIAVLDDRDHVRLRPAMYICDTGAGGLLNYAAELIAVSVNAAAEGKCTLIEVTIQEDGSIAVESDAPGISGEGAHSPLKKSFTRFWDGRIKFGGLFTVGLAPIAFLSDWMTVESHLDGRVWTLNLREGAKIVEGPLEGPPDPRPGLKIHAMPDPAIFNGTAFDYGAIVGRCCAFALYHRALTIKIADRRSGEKRELHYSGGAAQRLEEIAPLPEVDGNGCIVATGEVRLGKDVVRFDLAMKYASGHLGCAPQELYANTMFVPGGGAPLRGAVDGLVEAAAQVRCYSEEDQKRQLTRAAIVGAHLARNIAVVLTVEIPSPRFEGSSRVTLMNAELHGLMRGLVLAAVPRSHSRGDEESFWRFLDNEYGWV